MKISCWMIIITLLFSINLQATWVNIRHSSYTADSEIYLRYESPYNNGYEHQVYYFSNNEWQANVCENIFENTFQTVLPFSNIDPLSLSFRAESEDSIYLIPGFTTQQPVTIGEMTVLSEYERDLDIPTHQNIAGEGMLFSEDQLFFSMTNFGGGFPVSDGTFGPFYSYSIALWPFIPDTPEYVYVLVYTVNLSPYINPGLYKIDAVTDEMTQIGNITHQIDQGSNTIFLTCSWNDLINDSYFADTYSSDSGIMVSSIIQKIENFGTLITIMDEGNEHNIYLKKQVLEPFTNTLPEISNINVDYLDGLITITLDYFDQDGHFPLIGEVLFDNQQSVDFVAASNDFSNIVPFSCEFSENWSTGTIRFSDNLSDFVEHPLYNSIHSDVISPIPSSMLIYPNPFRASTGSDKGLTLRINHGENVDIEIYNLKGQRVFRHKDHPLQGDEIYLSRDLLTDNLKTSGFYLMKIAKKDSHRNQQEVLINRFLFLR